MRLFHPSSSKGAHLLLLFLLGFFLSGCSLGFQKSVRSSGTLCSNSRGWYIADATLGAAAGYFAATELNEGTAFIPAGVLLASAAVGVYKRRNCVHHQETATPEQWAQDRQKAKIEKEQQVAQEQAYLKRRALALAKARAAQKRAQAKARARNQAIREAYDRENDQSARQTGDNHSPQPSTRVTTPVAPVAPVATKTVRPVQTPVPIQSTVERRFRPKDSHASVSGPDECNLVFQDSDPSSSESSKYKSTCISCVNSGGGYWMIRGGKAPICGCREGVSCP